jgi:hypothetical protein
VKEDAVSPLELTYESSLRELLLHSAATVRLNNCIANDPLLGSMTIREYLENTDVSYARSLKTQHMGVKTAQELRQLVSAFALHRAQGTEPSSETGASEARAESPPVSPRDLIISALRPIKFPEALFDCDLSIRLQRVLAKFAADQRERHQPAASLSTLAHVVDKWDSTRAALLSYGNVGSKSLDELKGITEELVNRRFQVSFPHVKLSKPLHIKTCHPASRPISHGSLATLAIRRQLLMRKTEMRPQQPLNIRNRQEVMFDSGYWRFLRGFRRRKTTCFCGAMGSKASRR